MLNNQRVIYTCFIIFLEDIGGLKAYEMGDVHLQKFFDSLNWDDSQPF